MIGSPLGSEVDIRAVWQSPRGGGSGRSRCRTWDHDDVKSFSAYLRANPQVLILLVVCLVLGLGTFVAVLIGIAGSGSTTTDGYSSGAILEPLLG